MANIKTTESGRLSRRALLITGMAAGAAPLMLTGPAFAVPALKVSKDTVRYQEVASGGHRCGECRLFREPAECLDVAGTISKTCGCRIWIPKVA